MSGKIEAQGIPAARQSQDAERGRTQLLDAKRESGIPRHKVCDQLASRLCKDIGDTSETCKMVQTQTKTFPPDRCSSMIEHYTEVLADLRRMDAANQPLTAALQATLAKGDSPSFGSADAKVTMVEFSDFQCPYCPPKGIAEILA